MDRFSSFIKNELAAEIVDAGAIDLIDSLFSPETMERRKNVHSGNKTKFLYAIMKDAAMVGDIPVGFSKDDGRTFIFAPDPETEIPPNSIIKILTRH